MNLETVTKVTILQWKGEET